MNYWSRIIREYIDAHNSKKVLEEKEPVEEIEAGPWKYSDAPPKRVEIEWPKNPPPPLMTTSFQSEPEGRYKELIDEANKEVRRKQMMEHFQTIGSLAGLAALLLIVAYILTSREG